MVNHRDWPGTDREGQHILTDALDIHHQSQVVAAHCVRAQGDLQGTGRQVLSGTQNWMRSATSAYVELEKYTDFNKYFRGLNRDMNVCQARV